MQSAAVPPAQGGPGGQKGPGEQKDPILLSESILDAALSDITKMIVTGTPELNSAHQRLSTLLTQTQDPIAISKIANTLTQLAIASETRNPVLSLTCLKEAAQLENSEALCKLGDLYHQGKLLPDSKRVADAKKIAHDYYLRAALQKNTLAYQKISKMYSEREVDMPNADLQVEYLVDGALTSPDCWMDLIRMMEEKVKSRYAFPILDLAVLEIKNTNLTARREKGSRIYQAEDSAEMFFSTVLQHQHGAEYKNYIEGLKSQKLDRAIISFTAAALNDNYVAILAHLRLAQIQQANDINACIDSLRAAYQKAGEKPFEKLHAISLRSRIIDRLLALEDAHPNNKKLLATLGYCHRQESINLEKISPQAADRYLAKAIHYYQKAGIEAKSDIDTTIQMQNNKEFAKAKKAIEEKPDKAAFDKIKALAEQNHPESQIEVARAQFTGALGQPKDEKAAIGKLTALLSTAERSDNLKLVSKVVEELVSIRIKQPDYKIDFSSTLDKLEIWMHDIKKFSFESILTILTQLEKVEDLKNYIKVLRYSAFWNVERAKSHPRTSLFYDYYTGIKTLFPMLTPRQQVIFSPQISVMESYLVSLNANGKLEEPSEDFYKNLVKARAREGNLWAMIMRFVKNRKMGHTNRASFWACKVALHPDCTAVMRKEIIEFLQSKESQDSVFRSDEIQEKRNQIYLGIIGTPESRQELLADTRGHFDKAILKQALALQTTHPVMKDVLELIHTAMKDEGIPYEILEAEVSAKLSEESKKVSETKRAVSTATINESKTVPAPSTSFKKVKPGTLDDNIQRSFAADRDAIDFCLNHYKKEKNIGRALIYNCLASFYDPSMKKLSSDIYFKKIMRRKPSIFDTEAGKDLPLMALFLQNITLPNFSFSLVDLQKQYSIQDPFVLILLALNTFNTQTRDQLRLIFPGDPKEAWNKVKERIEMSCKSIFNDIKGIESAELYREKEAQVRKILDAAKQPVKPVDTEEDRFEQIKRPLKRHHRYFVNPLTLRERFENFVRNFEEDREKSPENLLKYIRLARTLNKEILALDKKDRNRAIFLEKMREITTHIQQLNEALLGQPELSSPSSSPIPESTSRSASPVPVVAAEPAPSPAPAPASARVSTGGQGLFASRGEDKKADKKNIAKEKIVAEAVASMPEATRPIPDVSSDSVTPGNTKPNKPKMLS